MRQPKIGAITRMRSRGRSNKKNDRHACPCDGSQTKSADRKGHEKEKGGRNLRYFFGMFLHHCRTLLHGCNRVENISSVAAKIFPTRCYRQTYYRPNAGCGASCSLARVVPRCKCKCLDRESRERARKPRKGPFGSLSRFSRPFAAFAVQGVRGFGNPKASFNSTSDKQNATIRTEPGSHSQFRDLNCYVEGIVS